MQAEIPIVRVAGETAQDSVDSVAEEEPLEIRINGESLTVTMRTPGDDFDLIVGFLLAEGIIRSASEIRFMGYGTNPGDPERQNVVDVALPSGWQTNRPDATWERKFAVNSSCGVCGKTNLASIRCEAPVFSDYSLRVSVAVIRSLPECLRAAQRVFDRTGGLHASGLFDDAGTLLTLREDVGRHNALDKLIGAEARAGHLPLSHRLLLVSGRASFELVQKAAVARIPIVCAVSAPSSLAVQLALDLKMTLIGFLRGETMNIYAGAERVML